MDVPYFPLRGQETMLVQDVVDFLKEYGLAVLLVVAAVVVEAIRPRVAPIKAFLRWAWEAKYVALGGGVIIAGLVTAAMAGHINPESPELVIRHTGLALQLAGSAIAIWAFLKTRAQFNLPPLRSVVRQWLKRCPLLRRDGVAYSETLTCTMTFGGSADAYGIHGVGDNPTIEALTQALLKNVENLHHRINRVKNELEGKISGVNAAVERAEQSRKKDGKDIRQELQKTATGGIPLAAVGASWLIVGSILSTASPELVKLIK